MEGNTVLLFSDGIINPESLLKRAICMPAASPNFGYMFHRSFSRFVGITRIWLCNGFYFPFLRDRVRAPTFSIRFLKYRTQ